MRLRTIQGIQGTDYEIDLDVWLPERRAGLKRFRSLSLNYSSPGHLSTAEQEQ